MYKYAHIVENIVIGCQTSTKEINNASLVLVSEIPERGDVYDPESNTWHKPVIDIATPPPILPLTNLAISSQAALVGSIYWLQKDVTATVTADVSLPDGDYMLMAERVIDAATVVDDIRIKVSVTSGSLTGNINFPVAGNYLISAKRLNAGFDRIGAGAHLSFNDIEFDIYV